MAPDFVYETNEGEKGKKGPKDEIEEVEKHEDEQEDVEECHTEGKGLNWRDQMVPVMGTFGGASGELEPLQDVLGNRETFMGMFWDYMDTRDV